MGSIQRHHIGRLAQGNAQALTLANGVILNAVVMAQKLTVGVKYLSLAEGAGRQNFFQEGLVIVVGNEANLLAVVLFCHRQADLPAMARTCSLV